MKKSFFVVVIAALFIMSGANCWAKTKPCPQCWAKLKASGIKNVKVTPNTQKNIIKVHMDSIKQALERTGINERVSVYLSVGDDNPVYLGSFAPSVRDDGERGDGAANRSRFKSIPRAKNVKVAPSFFHVNRSKTSGAVARSSTYARPARPSTLVRPARPARPPATMARPSRPARPSGPATQIQTQTRQGLLMFENSKGQAMVYLRVEINGM